MIIIIERNSCSDHWSRDCCEHDAFQITNLVYRSDLWLARGVAGYMFGLFMKKIFGNNEYRHWIREVCISKLTKFYLHLLGHADFFKICYSFLYSFLVAKIVRKPVECYLSHF